ncbi:MAG TPA: class I poly(R)-hydroxyalkanoic acid synthase [Bauldia sp.]|nr:class I poly(R)-hydroxyalkanoic acid synthase [Bauldia sp.]
MADDKTAEGGFQIKDPEAFARNLARVVEEAGRAASAYLKPREEGRATFDYADGISEVVKTLTRVAEYWLIEPERALEAERRLWGGYMDLWATSLKRMMGEPAAPVATPEPRDKRFADPEWSRNQFFDFLKQIYLITSRWADAMVDEASDVDEHTRQKAAFYVKQIANAVAPSNFVLTNPELLRETFSSNGENLVRGIHMLAEDIEAGGGDLKIRQSGEGDFELGRNLAASPGKVIFQNEIFQLIQYEPATPTVLKRPLLVVPPWINKFYILDLTPEKSFIRWAVGEGHTVFVISWVNPDERQAGKSFEHYMREGIFAALDVIGAVAPSDGVNAVGYCVGGTLLAVALAFMAAKGDERIRTATFFATQVDFTHAGDLKVFVDEEQIADLEYKMKMRGYLEGRSMSTAFNMLRSNDLIWPYVVANYFKGKQPQPFDLLYWNSDSTRMPAANHAFYLRNCYLRNRLSQGTMEVGGVRLDLRRSTVPVYNLATREAHIAPPRSVFYGSSFFGGKVTFVLTRSRPIPGGVNPPGENKYQYWTRPGPKGDGYDKWLGKAKEHPGSWWPHWQRWIESHDDARVKARKIGNRKYRPIEDAPGSYVKVKA